MKKLIVAAIIGLGFLTLAGCRNATIYNVNNAKYCNSSNYKVTMASARNDIVQALHFLGWRIIDDSKSGVVDAQLKLRGHMAKIRVTYNTTEYSITYVDSANLDYDATDPNNITIHKNYNGWVIRLSRTITNNSCNTPLRHVSKLSSPQQQNSRAMQQRQPRRTMTQAAQSNNTTTTQ